MARARRASRCRRSPRVAAADAGLTLDVFDDDAIERGVAVMRASRAAASDDASDAAALLAPAPGWLPRWVLRDR